MSARSGSSSAATPRSSVTLARRAPAIRGAPLPRILGPASSALANERRPTAVEQHSGPFHPRGSPIAPRRAQRRRSSRPSLDQVWPSLPASSGASAPGQFSSTPGVDRRFTGVGRSASLPESAHAGPGPPAAHAEARGPPAADATVGPSPKGRRVPPPAATSAAPTAAAGARASASPPAAGRSQAAAADEGSTIRTFFSSLGTADAADALEVVDSGVAGPGPRGESGGGDDRAEALALRRYARSLARAEGAFDRARHEAESLRVERDLLRERVTALAEQLEQAECSAHGAAAPSRESRSASPATGSGPERSPPGARDSGSEPEMPPGGQGEVVSVSRPPPPGSPPRRVLRALWEALPEGSGGEATDSASPAALVRAVRETTQSLHAARSEAAAAERARADAETRAQEAEAASRREQAEYAAAAVRSLESQAHASQQCRVSEQEAERLRGDVARLEKQLAEARAEASEEARRLRREREEAESRLGEVLQARQTEAEEAEEVVARLRARLGEQARDRERSREEGSGGTAPSSQGSGEGEAQLRRAHATVDSLRRRVSELETAGERASAAMVESRRRALQAENEAEAAVAREREQQKALERAAVAQREAVWDAEAARARVAELERAVAAAEERAASESTRAEESARAASRAAGADAKLRSTASALAAETARRETAEARAAAVEGALARGQRAGWGTLRACARYHAIVQAYSSLRVAALSRRAAMRALAPQNPASATADASELAGDETERVATFHRAQPRSDLLRRFAEKQTISILRQAPAWARLDDMLLRRFVAACDTVTFGSGEIIIKKGERGQRLYYILEGEVAITVPDPKGGARERLLVKRFMNQVVGEFAMLSDSPRTANVWATKPTKLLALTRTGFDELDRAFPNTFASLLGVGSGVGRSRATTVALTGEEAMSEGYLYPPDAMEYATQPLQAHPRNASSATAK